MEKEFYEQYKELFDFGMKRLKRCHSIKLHAIKFCKSNKEFLYEHSKFERSLTLKRKTTMAKHSINLSED